MIRHKAAILVTAATVLAACGIGAAYEYDPSDFASQVIQYVQGTGLDSDWITGLPFNDPSAALGGPTIDTSGDGWYIPEWDPAPVLSVNPAFRSYELVSVGKGGQLVLKFDHKVRDNPYNPYGSDLVIFGNSTQLVGSEEGWTNGDPTLTTVSGLVYKEPGRVSVSQDGVTWYSFPVPGPGARGADDFAPTLGRVYDPANPDDSLGEWNLWWGQPTNPTYPLNPALGPGNFTGMTVAQMAQAYGESAGGTGFDLGVFSLPLDPETGMKWIQYVRIENPTGSTVVPEVDAMSDVFARRGGDANLDGIINGIDLGILSANFGRTSGAVWELGDFSGDGVVNGVDLGILSANFNQDNGEFFGGGGGGPQPVPEPAALSLLGLGAAAGLRRRRT